MKIDENLSVGILRLVQDSGIKPPDDLIANQRSDTITLDTPVKYASLFMNPKIACGANKIRLFTSMSTLDHTFNFYLNTCTKF